MARVLLHVCCAPCSPWVVETLRREAEVALYYYNPNIHPESEWRARLAELERWAKDIRLPLVVEEYGAPEWFERVKGLEKEPERGARCEACFDMRLERAARKAEALGFERYGTVLTVSPHKDAAAVNRIGASHGEGRGVEFIAADWKKKEGYKITTLMARAEGFYRQDYCGCVYSRRAGKADDGA